MPFDDARSAEWYRSYIPTIGGQKILILPDVVDEAVVVDADAPVLARRALVDREDVLLACANMVV